MTSTKESFVLKHTAAVHIDNKLSLLERKIFNILLKNIRFLKNSNDIYNIHIKDLTTFLGMDEYTNYEFIKESLHNLVKRSLRFNILNKDKKKKWESSLSLLSEVHFEGGMIYYIISPSLKEAFSKPSSYAYLDIKFQNLLSSRHSLALWEFCCEQLDTVGVNNLITQYISVEKLKSLLGVEGKGYDAYKVFNNKIIKKSINEINKKTDIKVSSILTKKNGKKVEFLGFDVSRSQDVQLAQDINIIDSDSQINLIGPDIIDVINQTFEIQDVEFEASELNINKEDLHKFLNKHTVAEVRRTINYVKERIKSGVKINNVGAYIWKLLDQGIVETISLDKSIENNKVKLFYEAKLKFKNVDPKISKFFEMFADKYEDHFVNWIAKIDFVSYESGTLVMKAPSMFYRDWIIDNLESIIRYCGIAADNNFKNYIILLNDQTM